MNPHRKKFEIWKDIKGYEGLYQVSNHGRVKSFCRSNGKILKNSPNTNGYIVRSLSKGGKESFFKMHCLVWDHFGNKPRNGRKLQIDHKDNNKLNNHIDNLQLLTQRQNINKSRTNPNGHPGLTKYIRKSGKIAYHVKVWHKYTVHCVGTFYDKQKAIEAYNQKVASL